MSTPESSQEPEQGFPQHQTLLSSKPEIHISDSPPSSVSTPHPHPRSIPIQATPIQSVKKPSPLPWSNKETLNLIHAYQDKWYSLKRGQLKANQWEEVSVNVAIHCGYDEPSKTATQCRHKIEKLRKRFKAEKQRPNPRAWEFFDFMDRLEKGPLPISARPVETTNTNGADNNDDDEIYEAFCNRNSRPKPDGIDHNFRSRKVSRFSDSFSDLGNHSLNQCNLKRNRFNGFETESEDEDEEDDDEGDYGGDKKKEENKAGWVLAGEIRGFAGRFQQMENKKIEMIREIEKYRSDMEIKRIDMIRQSQRRIIDTINKALATRKN